MTASDNSVGSTGFKGAGKRRKLFLLRIIIVCLIAGMPVMVNLQVPLDSDDFVEQRIVSRFNRQFPDVKRSSTTCHYPQQRGSAVSYQWITQGMSIPEWHLDN
jgi:hypothetical protein